MNNGNHVHLIGSLWRVAWTRTPPGNPRGIQIRVWLVCGAGHRREFFLCAFTPTSAEELELLRRALQPGRTLCFDGQARMADAAAAAPDESNPGVLFMVRPGGYQIGEPYLPPAGVTARYDFQLEWSMPA